MQIHPDIAALRSDPTLQRHAQMPMTRAVAEWQSKSDVVALKEELEAYDAGRPLGMCETLSGVLSNYETASRFIGDWCNGLLAPLMDQPLGQVPLRHNVAPGLATLQLMNSGGTTLSLFVYSELSSAAEPQSAVFADREVCEIVLAGKAHGVQHQLTGIHSGRARINSCPTTYEADSCVTQPAGVQTREFLRVEGSMLLLQLTRIPAKPKPSREYLLSDGTLIHQVSADKRSSQHFMAVDVLGAMERGDAVPVMQELALCMGDDADLRWEAVRQTLALDAAEGMALLSRLSGRKDDPIAPPAASLKQTLIAANARLADLAKEAEPCPVS